LKKFLLPIHWLGFKINLADFSVVITAHLSAAIYLPLERNGYKQALAETSKFLC
jgi:hypothetical protein